MSINWVENYVLKRPYSNIYSTSRMPPPHVLRGPTCRIMRIWRYISRYLIIIWIPQIRHSSHPILIGQNSRSITSKVFKLGANVVLCPLRWFREFGIRLVGWSAVMIQILKKIPKYLFTQYESAKILLWSNMNRFLNHHHLVLIHIVNTVEFGWFCSYWEMSGIPSPNIYRPQFLNNQQISFWWAFLRYPIFPLWFTMGALHICF